jgi:cytochrome P450 family 710 subfamily A protein
MLQAGISPGRFMSWSKALNGPTIAIPVIGAIVEMVKNPYAFWERQRLFNPNGLSWNSICGQFMIFSTKTEVTKTIFMNNGEDSFRLFLHPSGWKILGMLEVVSVS